VTEPVIYVERTGKRKDGKPSIRTHRHYWSICDVCGEGTWVAANRLARTKDDPRPGLRCRMTAHCKGKHRKDDDDQGS
jgi:hypothetical protein